MERAPFPAAPSRVELRSARSGLIQAGCSGEACGSQAATRLHCQSSAATPSRRRTSLGESRVMLMRSPSWVRHCNGASISQPTRRKANQQASKGPAGSFADNGTAWSRKCMDCQARRIIAKLTLWLQTVSKNNRTGSRVALKTGSIFGSAWNIITAVADWLPCLPRTAAVIDRWRVSVESAIPVTAAPCSQEGCRPVLMALAAPRRFAFCKPTQPPEPLGASLEPGLLDQP